MKPVGEYLEELRATVATATHSHQDPCPVCEGQRYEVEFALLSTDPTCHRCNVPHPRAPSCPVCGANHYATREGDHWLCCYCWSIFHGSTKEWSDPVNSEHRAQFAAQRNRFLSLYRERYNVSMVQE